MNSTRQYQLSVLAIAAIVLLVALYFLGPDREREALRGNPIDRESHSDSLSQALPQTNRTLAPTADEASVVDRQDETAEQQDERSIIGIVVDESDVPVGDVEVRALASPNASFNTYDLEFVPERSVQATERTGADGRFRLEVPQYRPFVVLATAEGYASVEQESCYAGQSLVLRIRTGCELFGRFTESVDDNPVANVRFRVFSDALENPVEGTGVADGSYRVSSLPPGEASLLVIPVAHTMPRLIEVQLVPGTPTELNVSLESGRTIVGQVRDAQTGAGIPGAEVSSWSFLGKTARSDVHGAYVLRGIRETRSSLQARAPGYGRQERSFGLGDKEVVFELTPAASIRGRVVDESGTALPGAIVTACASGDDDGAQQLEWKTVASDNRGEFHIRGLRTDLELVLFARLSNFATQTRALPRFEPGRSELQLNDVVLRAHSVLAGRLLDQNGVPIEGRTIRLRGPADTPGP